MCACAFVFLCAQARVHQSLLGTDVNMSVGIDVQTLELMYNYAMHTHRHTHTDTQADILTCVFTFRCYGDVSCVEDGGRGIDTMVEHEISGLAEALLDQECSRPATMSFNNVDLQVCLSLCRCRRRQCLSVCSPVCLHVQSVYVCVNHTPCCKPKQRM